MWPERPLACGCRRQPRRDLTAEAVFLSPHRELRQANCRPAGRASASDARILGPATIRQAQSVCGRSIRTGTTRRRLGSGGATLTRTHCHVDGGRLHLISPHLSGARACPRSVRRRWGRIPAPRSRTKGRVVMPGATQIRPTDDDPRAESPAAADFSRRAPGDRSWRVALRVTLIYTLVSAAWIALSDQALVRPDPRFAGVHLCADLQGLGLCGGVGGHHLALVRREFSAQRQAASTHRVAEAQMRQAADQVYTMVHTTPLAIIILAADRVNSACGIRVRKGSSAGRPKRSSGASCPLSRRTSGRSMKGTSTRAGGQVALRSRCRPTTQGRQHGQPAIVDHALRATRTGGLRRPSPCSRISPGGVRRRPSCSGGMPRSPR